MTQSRRSSGATNSDRRSERSGSSFNQGASVEDDVTQPEMGAGTGFGRYGVTPKESIDVKEVQRSLGPKDEPRRASSRPSRTEVEPRRLSRKPQPGEDLSDISYLVGGPESEEDDMISRKSSTFQSKDSFLGRKGAASLPWEMSGAHLDSGVHLDSGAGPHNQASPTARLASSGRREVVEQPYLMMSGGGRSPSLPGAGAGGAHAKPGGGDVPWRSSAVEARQSCAPGNGAPAANEEPRASLQQRQSQHVRSSTAGKHQGKEDDKALQLQADATDSTKIDTDNASGSSRASRRSGAAAPPPPQPQAAASPPSRRSSAQAVEERAPEDASPGGGARVSRASRLAPPLPEDFSPPSRRSGAQAAEERLPEEDGAPGAARVSRASSRLSAHQQEDLQPPSRRSSAHAKEESVPEEDASSEARSQACRRSQLRTPQQGIVSPPFSPPCPGPGRRSGAGTEEEPAYSEMSRVVEEPQQRTGSLHQRMEDAPPQELASHRPSKRGSRAARMDEGQDEDTEVWSDAGVWRKPKPSDFMDRRNSIPERLSEENEGQSEDVAYAAGEEREERKSISLNRDIEGQVAGLVWCFGQDQECRGAWLKGFKRNAPLPQDHNLVAGDELISVNGELVRGLPRKEIEEIWLRSQPEAERFLHLEFIAGPAPAV